MASSYWRRSDLGRPCPWCGLRVPKVLERAGILIHPTCGPSEMNGWDVTPP